MSIAVSFFSAVIIYSNQLDSNQVSTLQSIDPSSPSFRYDVFTALLAISGDMMMSIGISFQLKIMDELLNGERGSYSPLLMLFFFSMFLDIVNRLFIDLGFVYRVAESYLTNQPMSVLTGDPSSADISDAAPARTIEHQDPDTGETYEFQFFVPDSDEGRRRSEQAHNDQEVGG